jgi:hypothetical protein
MRRLALLLVVMLSAVVAAADIEFLNVWKSPEVSRLNFAGKKVAAMVITDDLSLQMSGEEALSRELAALGVTPAATYRFVPREELKSAERAKPWFERSGVQGVVALRPVSRNTETSYSPSIWVSTFYSSYWDYYTYGWGAVYAPSRTSTSIVVVVETLVFDLTRNQLVWAATAETKDPKNLQTFVTDLVKAAVAEMKKMKLVG